MRGHVMRRAAAGVLLAAVLAGCGAVPGGSSGSTTWTSTPECQRLHDVLTMLAGVSYHDWNRPVGDLSADRRGLLSAVSVPMSEKASSAYKGLAEGPWAAC